MNLNIVCKVFKGIKSSHASFNCYVSLAIPYRFY